MKKRCDMKKLLSMLLVLTMFASMFASTAFAVTDSSFDRQTICLDIQTEALKQDARSLMPVDFQFQEKMTLGATLGDLVITRGIAEFNIYITGVYDAQYDSILSLDVSAVRMYALNLEDWALTDFDYTYDEDGLTVSVVILAEFDYVDAENNHYEELVRKQGDYYYNHPFSDD